MITQKMSSYQDIRIFKIEYHLMRKKKIIEKRLVIKLIKMFLFDTHQGLLKIIR